MRSKRDIMTLELEQVSSIESSRCFFRLSGVTQVNTPTSRSSHSFRTRQSHSQEVATSSQMMGLHLAEYYGVDYYDIDYQGSLRASALSHDLGVAGLGHDGCRTINRTAKSYGLNEGFSDNDHVLIVIENNHIPLSIYTKMSTVKYPEDMYPYLKERYGDSLRRMLEDDVSHYSLLGIDTSLYTRTVACEIMDTADRNTYITSGIRDYLSAGNSIDIDVIHRLFAEFKGGQVKQEFNLFASLIHGGDSLALERYFDDLRRRFNRNYKFGVHGLVPINHDLHEWREFLWTVEFELTIKPQRINSEHLSRMKNLEQICLDVFNNGVFLSESYQEKIEHAKRSGLAIDVLRLQRDMLAELSDWDIIHYVSTADPVSSFSFADGVIRDTYLKKS